jgi:hypothetical protein
MILPSVSRGIAARYALALLATAGPISPALAERSETAGEFTVHYNAIPTTALSPDVARSYGITRSGGRGFINIAVVRQRDGEALPSAVAARVTAFVRPLTGQRNPIELREIREQDAIYYIGDFRVRGEELLRFDVDVVPEGATRPIPVRFDQPFVGD